MFKSHLQADNLKYEQKDLMKQLLTEQGTAKLFHNENWIDITVRADETAYLVDINLIEFQRYSNFEEMYKSIDCEPISKVALNRLVAEQLAMFDKVIAEHIEYYSDVLEPPIEQLVGLLRVLEEAVKLCTLPSELDGAARLIAIAKSQVIEMTEAVYTEKDRTKPAYEVLRNSTYLNLMEEVKYLRNLVDNE